MPAHSIDPKERELKFALAAADVTKVKSFALLAPLRCREEPLLSTYFDTADLALANAGMSLRVRRSGTRFVQTLKRQSAPSGGFFVRAEHETECLGSEPDLAYVRRHCPPRLRKMLNGPLTPVFHVDVQRTEWPVSRQDTELIVSLDEGSIRAADKSEPICELEVELRHGNVEAAFDVARQIAKVVPLRLEVASKPERGYSLARDAALGPEKAPSTSLDPNLTTAAGFQLVASLCIHHFVANEKVFLATRSAEALHQMHVAVRRLHSAISCCKALFSNSERAILRAKIKPTFRKLGEARDLDIALGALKKSRDRQNSPAVLDISTKHQAGYAQLIEMLQSQRFCLCLLDVLTLVETGKWTNTENRAQRKYGDKELRVSAAATLERQWRKLGKFDDVSALSVKKRHRFRIRAKTFRYTCEFFGDLFHGAKQTRRRNDLLDALGTLQGELGDLNDLASMHKLLDQSARAGSGDLAAAEKIDEASEKSLLEGAEAAQRQVLKRRPFWS